MSKLKVWIDQEDLLMLIEGYRGQAAMPDKGMEELCDRLEATLKDGDAK